MGYTPLHYAVQFGAGVELLLLLLGAIGEVEMALLRRGEGVMMGQDEDEEETDSNARVCARNVPSPLYLACKRNAPLDVIQLLLEQSLQHVDNLQQCGIRIPSSWIAPTTGVESWMWYHNLQQCSQLLEEMAMMMMTMVTDSYSPLEALWFHFEDIHDEERTTPTFDSLSLADDIQRLSFDDDAAATAMNEKDPETTKIWNKILYLIDDTPHDRLLKRSSLLHSLAALKHPLPYFINFALRLQPSSMLSHHDATGRIPLHHAIMSYRPLSSFHHHRPDDYDRHRRNPHADVIHILLRESPETARIGDKDGVTPLVMALRRGVRWDEGLEALLLAAPMMLERRVTGEEEEWGLYPFMVAATIAGTKDGEGNEVVEMDAVYGLLRAFPELVGCGIPGN